MGKNVFWTLGNLQSAEQVSGKQFDFFFLKNDIIYSIPCRMEFYTSVSSSVCIKWVRVLRLFGSLYRSEPKCMNKQCQFLSSGSFVLIQKIQEGTGDQSDKAGNTNSASPLPPAPSVFFSNNEGVWGRQESHWEHIENINIWSVLYCSWARPQLTRLF